MISSRLAQLDRNDVLAINGERYEILGVRQDEDLLLELNRIGDSPENPRFLLMLEDSHVRFWERDTNTGDLLDVPVKQLAILGV